MHDVLMFASASFGKLLVAAVGLSIPIGFFYGCYRLVKARPILGTLILTTAAVVIVYLIARYAERSPPALKGVSSGLNDAVPSR
jgi:multisubunit Na+/H+ antiporter MnhC subunit